MPYKFGEYVSQYVDPQSIKISGILQERFMENFKSHDQLAMAVDAMKAALPFENDLAKKKQLQEELDSKLSQLTERGDFENLGFVIHKEAKDFAREYSPIKQNQELYQSAMEDLQKRATSKENGINAEQLKYGPTWMIGDYKGFEVDPATGRVKEGTMFSPKTIYSDPKIMDKLKDRLSILVTHDYKIENATVGVGEDGKWKIYDGKEVKEVKQDDVNQVVSTLLAEPDVKAYVDQLADMKSYAIMKSGSHTEILQSQKDAYGKAIEEANAKLNDKTVSSADKQSLKELIAVYTEEMKAIDAASDAANPDAAKAYLKKKVEGEIVDPVKKYASLAAYQDVVWESHKKDYDDYWQKKQQAELDALAANPVIEGQTITTAENLGGKTIDEKLTTIKNLTATADGLEKAANAEGLDPEIAKEKRMQASKLRIEANRINQAIKQATDNSLSVNDIKKQDPTLVDILLEMNPNASAGDLAMLMHRTFDNPGDQDFIDYKNKFNSKYGQNALEKHLYQYYGSVESLHTGHWNEEGTFVAPNTNSPGFYSKGLANLNSKFSFIKDSHINDKFKDQKTATVTQWGLLDGLTIEDRVAATNAAKGFFKDYQIPVHLSVEKLDGSKVDGVNLTNYKVSKYGFNSDTGMWVLDLVKVNNSIDGELATTVLLSDNQISSPELKRYTNSPRMKMATLIKSHDFGVKGQANDFKLVYNHDRNDLVSIRVISEGGGDPLLQLVDSQGNVQALDKAGKVKQFHADNEIFKSIVDSGSLEIP